MCCNLIDLTLIKQPHPGGIYFSMTSINLFLAISRNNGEGARAFFVVLMNGARRQGDRLMQFRPREWSDGFSNDSVEKGQPEPCNIKTDQKGRTQQIAGGLRWKTAPAKAEFIHFLLCRGYTWQMGGGGEVLTGYAYPKGACSHAQISAGRGMSGRDKKKDRHTC